jgi:hypothetical protein
VFIELFWQPTQPTPTPMTAFLHLLGPAQPDNATLWAQHDHPPQNGRIATDTWTPNRVYRDVHTLTLPLNAQPGTYVLTAGFYSPATGNRLLLSPTAPSGEPNGARLLTFQLPPTFPD